MREKVLIVGGAGYVGCVLVQELLDRGCGVRILDRLYYGDDGLRGVADRIQLVVGDMRAAPPDLFDDVCAVINLGGLSNDPTAEYNPKANYEMNTVASVRLAEACVAHGVPRYVYASSCAIYDRGLLDEQRDTVLDEDAPVSPQAAYAVSKREAEPKILALATSDFTPVVFRKGTIYGFSPRMRYDLVVNTFVKDALSKGVITLHCGGELWRPLVDVHDVAQAYVLALQAPKEVVAGEIFNVVYQNYRISELALQVREVLRNNGVPCDVKPDYTYRSVRTYRVSGRKLQRLLGFHPSIDVSSAVTHMLQQIRTGAAGDFENPRYYNIQWMRLLEQAQKLTVGRGSIFELVPQ
jgi:nucleoside-diphosphate-sugar epimerase